MKIIVTIAEERPFMAPGAVPRTTEEHPLYRQVLELETFHIDLNNPKTTVQELIRDVSRVVNEANV